MYLDVRPVKEGYFVDLFDSGRRILYASFLVSVKNHCICSYIFKNYQLTSMTFQYWCRYVCNLSLLWFRRNAPTGFFLDEDFETR